MHQIHSVAATEDFKLLLAFVSLDHKSTVSSDCLNNQ